MSTRVDNPELLDLTRFSSREASLALAQAGCPEGYSAVTRRFLEHAQQMTVGHLLFTAMVSRARGLHEAVTREIVWANPHAVLPLQRALLELVATNLYVDRDPEYITTLTGLPPGSHRKPKSFQAIFHAVRSDAAGLQRVYRELSEYSHFRGLAIFNAQSSASEHDHMTVWTDRPHWRDEDHFRSACALTEELAAISLRALEAFGQRYLVPPFNPATVIGASAVSMPLLSTTHCSEESSKADVSHGGPTEGGL